MSHDVAKSGTSEKPLVASDSDICDGIAGASPKESCPGHVDVTEMLLGQGHTPATAARAREWQLVLTARAIPHVLRRQGEGWRLCVPPRHVDEALAEMLAYAEERAARPLLDPEAVPLRPSVWPTVLAVVGVLTGCFGWLLGNVDPWGRPLDWQALGAGDSTAMLAGQWWRAVTALTLHADPAHLFGNAVCGALFLCLLCRETGVGLGFVLCLAAGAMGNVTKALIQGPGMHFLGASTAVFGALGALGGVRLASGWPRGLGGRSASAGAVLMLLAMLGAGSGDGGAVDLAGHLFGFGAGVLLGLGAGWLVERRGRPGTGWQVVAGMLAVVGLVGGWAWALVR